MPKEDCPHENNNEHCSKKHDFVPRNYNSRKQHSRRNHDDDHCKKYDKKCIIQKCKDGKNGLDGKDGQDGEDGKNGKSGRDGKDGRDGQDGKDGENGEDGRDGRDGKDGKDGKDGENGKNGEDGRDGRNGKDGRYGKDGENGEDGKDGENGCDGQDGCDGHDGKDGKDGRDGRNGKDGQDGEDGRDGKDGEDGQDGENGRDGQDGCDGEKGEPGLRGPKGCDGQPGCKGNKGSDGERGCTGSTGSTGPSGKGGSEGPTGPSGKGGSEGPTGPSGKGGVNGSNGPTGPTGPVAACVCTQYANTFITPNLTPGPQDVKVVYNIPQQCNFVVYGFNSLNVPSNLYIRTGKTPSYENGIGLVVDSGLDNEIDLLHYIQLDLGDFNRVKNNKCADPTFKIGSIQVGEGFIVYGSNILGQKGTVLYNYTNSIDNTDANAAKQIVIPSYNTTNLTSTGDLYLYGAIPFRYISVTATTGNVILNLLTLNLCSC